MSSLPKRPHSPSRRSHSPPAKRRAHSPEEGEVDGSPSTSRGNTPVRRGGGGDFYRPVSPQRRQQMFDSYVPDLEERVRSRSRHRLPARPVSPNGYERHSGGGERERHGGGERERHGGDRERERDRNGGYDRWQPPSSRGRTRNPYAESESVIRPLDTPGAPMVEERVGIEESTWERDRERGRQWERGSNGDRERPVNGDRDREWGDDRERTKPRVPLAAVPPNPPQAQAVDQKITDTLNDTIARIEREANEADSKGKPKVLRRTAEQEMQAYGRKFVGTSQLRDYAISEKLGEGTFGEVHKATHMVSKRVVALKRILMHNEKEGVPVTALREIKILKMLSHPSVVTVCDMVVEAATRDRKGSIYMVFPYMDHDLAGLLENPAVKFSPSQIKLYMRQLLEGTEYLHRNKILHRDLKAANLLIDNQGCLQIADFGLARPYSTSNPGWDTRGDASEFDAAKGGAERGGGGARYTNCVVTRWYRPPELLMGEARYGCAIDLWGVGCIMGEMWTRRPILCGSSDADQLDKIWELCGTPDEVVWPGWRELPGMDGVKPGFRVKMGSRVRVYFSSQTAMDEPGVDLLVKLLTLNPANRITAFEALDHEYFWSEPLPCDPASLPKYTSSHEYDKRKKAEHGHGPGPQMMPGPGPGMGYHGPMPGMQLPLNGGMNGFPGGPPNMHAGGAFRPPGGWGGPNGAPLPFSRGRGGGGGERGRGGRGGGRGGGFGGERGGYGGDRGGYGGDRGGYGGDRGGYGGGERGGYGRGGRGGGPGRGRHFDQHHNGPPGPGPGPNFHPGPGMNGNSNGVPPVNFSGYSRSVNGDGGGGGGEPRGSGGGGGGGGGGLPPPLGTHSREHRQARERNIRRGGPPPRDSGTETKPPLPPPGGEADVLPYG